MCRASTLVQRNIKQSTEQCHSGGTAQAAFDIDLEMQGQVEFRRLDQRQNLVDHGQH